MDTIIKTNGILCLRFLPRGHKERPTYGLLEVDVDNDILIANVVDLDDELACKKYIDAAKGSHRIELSGAMWQEIESGMEGIKEEILTTAERKGSEIELCGHQL